jgi:hypothetical protein
VLKKSLFRYSIHAAEQGDPAYSGIKQILTGIDHHPDSAANEQRNTAIASVARRESLLNARLQLARGSC